jgi:hypothetical protein
MQAATHDEKQALNSSGSIPLITVLSQSMQGPFLIGQIDGHIRTEAANAPARQKLTPLRPQRLAVEGETSGVGGVYLGECPWMELVTFLQRASESLGERGCHCRLPAARDARNNEGCRGSGDGGSMV